MQYHTLALLAALSAAALASPAVRYSHDIGTANATAAAELPALVKRSNNGPANSCGDSMFFDRTSGASPLVDDCRALIDYIAATGVEYIIADGELPAVDAPATRDLALRTCVLGWGKAFYGSDKRVWIGAQDAMDLIGSSIDKYQSDGRVGSEGAMYCSTNPSTGEEDGVWWGVFHS